MKKCDRKNERKQSFAFTTSASPEVLRERVCEAVRAKGEMLYEDTEAGFDLGVSRGGHSGGFWYTATLTETEDGTEMRGEIVFRTFHGDEEVRKNAKWKKISEWILIVIFFLPVLLIALPTWGILLLIGKLRGKPVEATMSTEEKLTHFMTEVMGCNTIE